jgi:hypothetical protein
MRSCTQRGRLIIESHQAGTIAKLAWGVESLF